MKRRTKNNSGQSAIEFIVVSVVIFFFLFFFMSLAFMMVVSDYLEFATFMAARTYKSSVGSEETQRDYAQRVFDSYAQRVEGIARNFQLEFVQVNPNDNQTAGVVSRYEMDLFYLPPLFISADDQPVSAIELSSEALLGRDPTFSECVSFFEDFAARFNIGIGGGLSQEMVDNGC